MPHRPSLFSVSPVAKGFRLGGGWVAAPLLALACAGAAHAAGGSIQLEIRATVLRVLQMAGLRQPASVQVTSADIARGYVDLPDAMVFDVKTNNPEGYAVHLRLLTAVGTGTLAEALSEASTAPVAPNASPFVGAAARLGTQTVSFGRDEAVAAFQKPGVGMYRTTHQLGIRLQLATGSAPGVYGWPVALFVTPA